MLRMCLQLFRSDQTILTIRFETEKKIIFFELRKMAIIAADDDC